LSWLSESLQNIATLGYSIPQVYRII
jgi:hypothetical protein